MPPSSSSQVYLLRDPFGISTRQWTGSPGMDRREHTHRGGGHMIKEFREFLLRGSVVDLAIAVVLGAAFGAVVTSFVNDILMQLIAMIGGQPDFSGLSFTINDAEFRYGEFLNAVIAFVIIGAAVFFLVVRPVNVLLAPRKAGVEP